MQNIGETLELYKKWIPIAREMPNPHTGELYRHSIFSRVEYDSYACPTTSGHAVKVRSMRKDFYKPRNYQEIEEGYFALNQMLKRERLMITLESEDKMLSDFVNMMFGLLKEGYVLDKYPTKTLVTTNWVSNDNWNFFKEKFASGYTFKQGHIRSYKHKKPLYEGHTSSHSDSIGPFFYKTELCTSYKQDIDYRALKKKERKQLEIDKKVDLLLDNGHYNVGVTLPENEEIILEDV